MMYNLPQQNNIPQSTSTRVELYFSCQKLKNMDLLSKSDPVVQIEVDEPAPPSYSYSTKKLKQRRKKKKKKQGGNWKLIGQTEMIKNNLNPNFNKTIQVEYRFERDTKFRFKVWDIDQSKYREIIGAKGQAVRKPLKHRKAKEDGKHGFITIRAEEIGTSSNDLITISPSGIKLKKMDTFGKSDGYFILQRKRKKNEFSQGEEEESEGEEDWIQIYKSEIIKKSLNPTWKSFRISMSKLCRCDPTMRIRCTVFDWDRRSSDDEIGYFNFTAQQLIDTGTGKYRDYTLKYDKKPKSRRGTIRFIVKQIKKRYSFFEYLRGNMEVSLVVAIDFTLSNGKPSRPTSLHYQGDPNSPSEDHMNEYQSAIRSIGDILANYDSDNMYPVLGFGAKVPPNWEVSHCFNLSDDPGRPEVHGVDGILESYRKTLRSIKFSGPTYFHEVVDETIRVASEERVTQDTQQWYILLIITDGEINKIEKTIHSIIQASYHPISIIIVGVGDEDFTNMDRLDCDDGLLRSAIHDKVKRRALRRNDRRKIHKVARADIVQFVPFSKFKNSHVGLAAETLAEVPDQVVEYFKWRKIVPNPRPQIDLNQMMRMMIMNTTPEQNDPNWNFLKQQMVQQPQQGGYGDQFSFGQPQAQQQGGAGVPQGGGGGGYGDQFSFGPVPPQQQQQPQDQQQQQPQQQNTYGDQLTFGDGMN